MQQQSINDAIDHLSAKLSVPAAHLWTVLVRQARVEAITDIVYIVMLLGLLGALNYVRHRVDAWAAEDTRSWSERGEAKGLFYIFGTVGAVVMVVFTVCLVGEVIRYTANPEYFAASTILNALR